MKNVFEPRWKGASFPFLLACGEQLIRTTVVFRRTGVDLSGVKWSAVENAWVDSPEKTESEERWIVEVPRINGRLKMSG